MRNVTAQLTATVASMALLVGVAYADVTVTPDVLKASVTESVLAQAQSPGLKDAQWVVEVLNLPTAPITLKGQTLQIFVNDTRTNPYANRSIAQVTLSTEAETRQLGVPVRLSLEQPVWVSTHFIRAKDPLKAGDFVRQTKRLTQDAAWVIPTDTMPTGYTARINIMPGTVLDNRKVNITPVVSQNSDVTVVYRMNTGVQMSIIGKALENGVMGQQIKVRRTLENRKSRILTGQVIGKNQVLVEM